MTIPASQIVNVTPRVISAGGTDLEITGLILTDNPLAVFPGVTGFTSANAVGEYFGTQSAEYLAAVNYFLGYNNSFRKPRRLNFARMATSAIAGSLIGGTAGSMDEMKAITAGGMTISIDGSAKTVTALDLSESTTQSDVAVALQGQLTGTSVQYNSNLNAFVITSSTTGDSSGVSVATDAESGQNLATVLGLTADAGATVSAGSAALTPAALMSSVTNQSQNWVSFTTITEQADDVVEAFAEWASGTNCEYLYVPYTTQAADVNPNAGTNLPKSLAENNYEGVALAFGGLDYALLIMSIGACIDWDRNNGLVTYAFKSQDGLAASVTDETTAANCVTMNVNFYGKYATRNDEFLQTYPGAMIGGQFGYIDAFVGNLWLRNALQVSIMNGLNSVGRVPYTEEGYTLIRAWCADPINRALNNGAIDPGVELSESQRAQLMNEIGEDVSSEIYTNGYYLLVADPGAQARVNRDTPTLGLWYTYGGSVHKIDLPVTAVL